MGNLEPRFGVVYDYRNPPDSGLDHPSLYAQSIEQVEWLDGLGLDHVWFTEHHFVDDGYLPAWIPVAAAMAARSKNIRFSTDVTLLPFQNPLRLAEDLAVLDNISNGRVELGVGMGYAPSEFEAFGFPRSQRLSRTEECMEILTRCFTGERFSFEGKRYKVGNAKITPGYVQEGGPPVWMAVTQEPSAERAARFNTHILPQGPRAETLGNYYSYLDKYDHSASDKRVGIIRGCFVTNDIERDLEKLTKAEEFRWKYYENLIVESKQNIWAGEDVMPQDTIIGDVDTCVETLTNYMRQYGITDLVTWGLCPGYTAEEMAEPLEAFTTQVVPAVKKALADNPT